MVAGQQTDRAGQTEEQPAQTNQQISSTPTSTIPDVLPVMPLGGGVVLFPLVVAPIIVTQERSRRLVDDVMSRDRMLVVVSPRPGAPEQPGPDDLHQIGTVAVIHQMMRAADGSLRLLLQGLERVR